MNVANKIIEIKIWRNSKDKKHRIHDLNKKEVELWHNDKIAKGDIKIKTCIIINRKEYEKVKLKNPIEIILFKIPSRENISMEELNNSIVLILSTKVEKLILISKISSPKERIDKDKIELKDINNLQRKKEKFIKSVQIINLKIKWEGFSKLLIIQKLDNINFIVKNIKNPKTNELDINNIPDVGELDVKIEKNLLS